MELIEAFIAVALAMLGLYSLSRGLRPGAGTDDHCGGSANGGCNHGTCDGCTGALVQLAPPASIPKSGSKGAGGRAGAAPTQRV